MQSETLIKKIEGLPPEAIAEIEDFVDFLSLKTQRQINYSRDESIKMYASKHAGSDADLDEEFEAASIDFLLHEQGK